MKVFLFPDKNDQTHYFSMNKVQKQLDLLNRLEIDGIPRHHGLKLHATWKNSRGETFVVSYVLMELIVGVNLLDFINAL